MSAPTKPGVMFDAVGPFPDGMDSALPPVLLAKSQLAYARNATMNDGFAAPRPAHRDISLTYESASVEAGFTLLTWQGASYYKPDYGPEAIVCAVGGKLFRVDPTESNAATIKEITSTISGLSANARQCWLWQAENWVIANDGETLPIFYDGAAARHSTGQGITLGTIVGSFTVPAINETVAVTLTGTFLGKLSEIVLINGARYQVVPDAEASYSITLKNITDATASYPVSTEIKSSNTRVGLVVGAATMPANFSYQAQTTQVSLSAPYDGGLGTISGSPSVYTGPLITIWPVNSFGVTTALQTSPFTITIAFNSNHANAFNFTAGMLVTKNIGTEVLTTVGALLEVFTVPTIGSTLAVKVDRPYSGTLNSYVWIGNQQYQVTGFTNPPASTGIILKNLDDLSGTQSGDIRTVSELPAGRCGAYGMGRVWMSLTDGASFIASDLVGGASGTLIYGFRDAVLKTNENEFLAGGGSFRVPGAGTQITAMMFTATLDASLGQGPLQVFTHYNVFSCQAPIDRLEWQDLANPILTESLIANGAESFYGTTIANGDPLFRSVDGLRSLILARRDFTQRRANTPISVEMTRVLQDDDQSLLGFASAVVFDNRLLITASPVSGSRGVYHSKLIVMNFDPSSSLRGALPDIYDGAWDGLNILQMVVGRFNGAVRCFAFCYDASTDKICLKELLRSGTATFDNSSERIQWELELPCIMVQPDPRERQLLRLDDGELMVDQLSGTVDFAVYFRPDYDPTWRLWHQFQMSSSPAWNPRVGLGQPNNDGDSTTGRPYRVGYHFQVKLVITGQCRFMGANFQAVVEPRPQFASPLPSTS